MIRVELHLETKALVTKEILQALLAKKLLKPNSPITAVTVVRVEETYGSMERGRPHPPYEDNP